MGAVLLTGTSCKKEFLDENLVTTKSLQDLQTPLGLDDLSIGMYQNLKFNFNYEWSYATTNYGVVDKWTWDFGQLNSDLDTSRLRNPNWTFADTGSIPDRENVWFHELLTDPRGRCPQSGP